MAIFLATFTAGCLFGSSPLAGLLMGAYKQQAYADFAVCSYARVLQKLNELRLACPRTEVGSKYYKVMEDCVTFRARPDTAPYTLPGATCDTLQPPSLPACQSDKTAGAPSTVPLASPTPTTRTCAAVHFLSLVLFLSLTLVSSSLTSAVVRLGSLLLTLASMSAQR